MNLVFQKKNNLPTIIALRITFFVDVGVFIRLIPTAVFINSFYKRKIEIFTLARRGEKRDIMK